VHVPYRPVIKWNKAAITCRLRGRRLESVSRPATVGYTLQQSNAAHRNKRRATTAELGPRFKRLGVMPCEMHTVADTPASGAAIPVTASPVPDVTTTAAACACIHRKRTLDTLRQRLARRLKRARRHRHDVIDAESTGDDVSDDVDTSTGELIILPWTGVLHEPVSNPYMSPNYCFKHS